MVASAERHVLGISGGKDSAALHHGREDGTGEVGLAVEPRLADLDGVVLPADARDVGLVGVLPELHAVVAEQREGLWGSSKVNKSLLWDDLC